MAELAEGARRAAPIADDRDPLILEHPRGGRALERFGVRQSDSWAVTQSSRAPALLLLLTLTAQVSVGNPGRRYPRGEIHGSAHSGQRRQLGRIMIQTQRQAQALVSTRRHGPPRNGGAPSEHRAPTIWKIAAVSGNESSP